MVIFGTRGVTSTAERGRFHCPTCNGATDYAHKRVRRFFTLYFIPIIPLNVVAEYIECARCRGTYKLEVLDYDPSAGQAAFEAEFHSAVKRVMVEMMLADGSIADEEVAVMKDIYRRLAGRDLEEADLQQQIVDVETHSGDVGESLKGIAGYLNDAGKEMVLKAAFMIAVADQRLDEGEKKMIVSIGEALEMTPAHVNGVIAQMLQDQEQE